MPDDNFFLDKNKQYWAICQTTKSRENAGYLTQNLSWEDFKDSAIQASKSTKLFASEAEALLFIMEREDLEKAIKRLKIVPVVAEFTPHRLYAIPAVDHKTKLEKLALMSTLKDLVSPKKPKARFPEDVSIWTKPSEEEE